MGRKKNFVQPGEVPTQDFRIELDRIFNDFMENSSLELYTFPADLDNIQRKYIHKKSIQLGIKSKSRGKEPNRILTISKEVSINDADAFNTFPTKKTISILGSLVQKAESMPMQHNLTDSVAAAKPQTASTFGKLTFMLGLQEVSTPKASSLKEFRQTLPIYQYKNDIMQAITGNQVVLIAGETGSGKTTQVPQYILEQAAETNSKVFIVCTQPRRLSAVAMAERVAAERGESAGSTIGYQIKLESKVSLRTALIYCTTGVLLRTLMDPERKTDNISHIIVDEIHERDKFSDFLMISLRELLPHFPNLRVILMSATMDLGLFVHYFKRCSPTVFDIPGRNYPVAEWFLDDILPGMKYENNFMKSMRQDRPENRPESLQIESKVVDYEGIEPDIAAELNETILLCWADPSPDTDDHFSQLMQNILSYSIDVNYQEPVHGLSALMVAAMHGKLEIVLQLLSLRAEVGLRCAVGGRTAREYAVGGGHMDVVHVLDHHSEEGESGGEGMAVDDAVSDYYATVQEDRIDFELVAAIVKFIHNQLDKSGGILIFLPGYDDIMICSEWIKNLGFGDRFEVFMLHGSMPIKQQNAAFRRLPAGKQKIVLATNVAETSITIDDVRYVIDCGRLKEKTYDSISVTSTLSTTWISKACAKQRAGRAGRTSAGYCFHVYSKKRYDFFDLNRIPEILRVPLQEICLSTKMLAPTTMSIENYLNLAIQPPSVISIRNAITSLQHLGALDAQENLTVLGKHLVQLSVDPHLGKMVIYSTLFKCLDPVLTIVACLTHKDPFNLPTNGSMKLDSQNKKKAFSENTLSDHMVFLRVFQQYQEAKANRWTSRFCSDNYINIAAMEMITLTRTRILGQLRAAGFVLSSPKDSIQDLNANANCWPLVKMVIVSGLYPNIIYTEQGKLRSRTEKKIIMHASSCLKKSDYEKEVERQTTLGQNWIMFEELAKVGRFCSIRFGTVITPISIALICGEEIKPVEDEFDDQTNIVEIDGWLRFRDPGFNLITIRTLISNLIHRKVSRPYQFRGTALDEQLIGALVECLTDQDGHVRLPAPVDIGKKPLILQQTAEQPHGMMGYDQGGGGGGYRGGYGNSARGGGGGMRGNSGPKFYGKSRGSGHRSYEGNNQSSPNSSNHQSWRSSTNNYTDQQVTPSHNGQSYQNGQQQHQQQSYQNGQPFYRGQHQPQPQQQPQQQQQQPAGGQQSQNNYQRNNRNAFQEYFRGHRGGARNNYRDNYQQNGPSTSNSNRNDGNNNLHETNSSINGPNTNPLNSEIFPENALYFIIKPVEEQNIDIALTQNGWKFAAQTEKKLFKFYLEGLTIILVFAVRNTTRFYGIAKLLGTNFGCSSIPCKIEWISDKKMPFVVVKKFIHPKIHIVEDGQQLDSKLGQQLCSVIYNYNEEYNPYISIDGNNIVNFNYSYK